MKATPTLRGKEAERFRKKEIANRKKRASKKEVSEAVRIFCRILENNEKAMMKLAKDFIKNSKPPKH